MVLHRHVKPTLTPFHLNHGETIVLHLSNGELWEMTLISTSADILSRGPFGGAAQDPSAKYGDIYSYSFSCQVRINGRLAELRREVGTQQSFYQPRCLDGVNLWFDAASCVFEEQGGFLGEKDWAHGLVCQPQMHARFVVQEAHASICPERLHPWFESPTCELRIEDCYNGEDCWMGPYSGGAAHCGLDINMPAGTILYAPIDFDDQYLFASTAAGYTNNRWKGVRRWPDGSEWCLQSHHLISMLVPERTPLKAGTPYATTAGVAIGSHEHTHFNFRILEQGGDYLLDPWILFWEMLQGDRPRSNPIDPA